MKRKKNKGRGEGKGGEWQSATQLVNEIFIKGLSVQHTGSWISTKFEQI